MYWPLALAVQGQKTYSEEEHMQNLRKIQNTSASKELNLHFPGCLMTESMHQIPFSLMRMSYRR